ncbi:MAG: CofH family radical SAM protein [Bacteroidia bacterium]|nr:CofH family radical SAM protein [Bacteroidia bacterium]
MQTNNEMAQRIYTNEAIGLYSSPDINVLSRMATSIREELNGKTVWYNKNFHLEPSNVCIHNCKFCSYRRGNDFEPGAWTMDLEQIKGYCLDKFTDDVTEVHVVGSVHPSKDVGYYLNVIETIRKTLPPHVTIKAYSAVEIDDMCNNSGMTPLTLLERLKELGVSALPGGGAEIFNPGVRAQICPDKADGQRWLEIHEIAHSLGMRSNATMLFGHIETRAHRIEHLMMLRELQDRTGGFDAFIPLLFKASNNTLSYLGEADTIEILRTFAISRIVLDNFRHIKSYWPMLGREQSQLALLYGADDVDGTINDSTKIYSMAGSKEQKPVMTAQDLEAMAAQCGYVALERDSFYRQVIKK